MKKTILLLAVAALMFTSLAFGSSGEKYFKSGDAYFKKRDYPKAISYFNAAIKMEPRNQEYYAAIAACYEKMKNPAKAKKYRIYAESLSKMREKSAPDTDGQYKATAFAGFTTAAMGKLNDYINAYYTTYTGAGGIGVKQNIGSAFMIGAQGGYKFMQGLYAGPRLEYIGVLGAKTEFTSGYSIGSTEYTASILNLLVGASYYYPLQGQPFMISGDLYVGYGMAGASVISTASSYGAILTETIPVSGGALVTVISASGNMKLSKQLSAGLTLGYRLANVASMATTQDIVVSGMTVAPRGFILTGADGLPMPFDFSGLIISLNGNFSF